MLALTLVPGWGQGLAARRHARPHPGPRLGPGAKFKKFGLSKRQYSTYTDNASILDKIDNNKIIKFDSLEEGFEQMKYTYLGVSPKAGVYKLTNKNDLSRFYIGSSNNLASESMNLFN